MRVSCSDRKPTGGVGTAQVTHKYFEEDGKIGEGEGGKEERRGGEGGELRILGIPLSFLILPKERKRGKNQWQEFQEGQRPKNMRHLCTHFSSA